MVDISLSVCKGIASAPAAPETVRTGMDFPEWGIRWIKGGHRALRTEGRPATLPHRARARQAVDADRNRAG